jgi:hypothetical protein
VVRSALQEVNKALSCAWYSGSFQVYTAAHHEMQEVNMNPGRRITINISGTITALLVLAIPVFSQRDSSPPPIDRAVNAERARQQDMSRREYQLRNLGVNSVKPDRKKLEALMAQTQEDFTRILTLHNEIVRLISSDRALDYHFVSEAASEIRKRASRLQDILVLGEASKEEEKTDKAPIESSEMKGALVTLCKQIKSFVTNPVIETPGTFDAVQTARARQDLESVIHLSGRIKKDANRLSKSHESQ